MGWPRSSTGRFTRHGEPGPKAHGRTAVGFAREYMRTHTHHETLYRGTDVIARLAAVRVTLCGAGALGSHLTDNLVRQGVRSLRVIDHDTVESHNVGTQLYGN